MSVSRTYNIAPRQEVPDRALKGLLDPYFNRADLVLYGSGHFYAIKTRERGLNVGNVNRSPDTLLRVEVSDLQKDALDFDKLQFLLEQAGYYRPFVPRMPREADTRIQIVSEGVTKTPDDNFTIGDAVRRTWSRRYRKQ